jgi:hypothetical protein
LKKIRRIGAGRNDEQAIARQAKPIRVIQPRSAWYYAALCMLTIREGQLLALQSSRLDEFRSKALAHLQESFPEECAAATLESLRSTIDLALDKTAKYAITSESDILRYLNFMFVCGRQFDEKLSWASEVLDREDLEGPEKVETLFELIKGRLEAGAPF